MKWWLSITSILATASVLYKWKGSGFCLLVSCVFLCVRENYLFETASVQCHPPGKFIKESRAGHIGTLCLMLNSVVSHSFPTPWTVTCQKSPLSMRFCRQEYWSGLPCLSFRGSSPPRDLTWVPWVCSISRRVLYHCPTWEAHTLYGHSSYQNSRLSGEQIFIINHM